MSQLIIPVGIPGCGKSTFAKTFFPKHGIISTDQIRANLGDVQDQSRNDEVFARYHEEIQMHLDGDFSVFADATNLTPRARRAMIEIANYAEPRASERIDIHMIVFDNCDQAVKRNQGRDRVVPDHAMTRMLDQYEKFKLDLPQERHLYSTVTEIRGLS